MKSIVLMLLFVVVCLATALSQDRFVAERPSLMEPRTVGRMADDGLIHVRSYTGDRGFLAPDSLAKIEGFGFVEEGFMPVLGFPLPKQIGGVRVWLGKQECGLRSVSPGFVVFLVPPVSVGWQVLTVESPLGWRATLAFVLPISPAIFTNPDGTVQGNAIVNSSQIVPFVGGAILNNNTQLRLWCSGIRHAADVTAFIGFETNRMERGSVKVSSHPLFAGIDFALMDLPPEARGDVRITLAVDGLYSNQVMVRIAE